MRLYVTLLILALCGCQTTGQFRGSRDAVFEAALASVPMTVGGMRLESSDRAKGTFKGLLVDGFGNVYLNGRVRPVPADGSGDSVIVEVNAWSWSLATLFLLPLDAGWAERQFLEELARQIPRALTTAPTASRVTPETAE